MSSSAEPFSPGQQVHLLLGSGVVSAKRYEVVKVWRYPTTFRYLLDSGYVADQSELRAADAAPGTAT
jgi:hypothetical protein